jgi:hypothetical protein
MSYKDAGANQAEDCRYRFNHFDAPFLHYRAGRHRRRLFQDHFIDPT